MSNRLDQQTDQALMAEIMRLRTDVDQLKSRQSINRSLITKSIVSQSSNPVDLSAINVPANTTRYFYIRFATDTDFTYPYGVQFSQVYNGGTDSAHRLSDYGIVDSTGAGYFWFLQSASSYSLFWVIGVNAGSTDASVYLKVRTVTTNKGSLDISYSS